jgi:hypothetical protein
VTPAAFRRLALSFPEAHEEPHFERTSFRVGKKIFATMTGDGSEAMVRVAPPDKVDALLTLQPDVFFSYGGWTERNGSLGVRLKKIGEKQMRELVVESWKHAAPKKLVATFDESARPARRGR